MVDRPETKTHKTHSFIITNDKSATKTTLLGTVNTGFPHFPRKFFHDLQVSFSMTVQHCTIFYILLLHNN